MPFILLKRGKFISIAKEANSCSALGKAAEHGERARDILVIVDAEGGA